MAKFSLETHQTRKTKAGTTNTVATQPYVRFADPDGGIYFLQHGQFFTAGGQVVKEVPAWVKAQADALDPKVKLEVGWGVQNSDAARAAALALDKDPKEVADRDQPEQAPQGVAGNPADDKKPAPVADPKKPAPVVPGPVAVDDFERDDKAAKPVPAKTKVTFKEPKE